MKKMVVLSLLGCLQLFAQIPEKQMLKVFDAACKMTPQENVLLSPWGIQQCFGMVSCGAGMKTGKELRDVLGLDQNAAGKLKQAGESLKNSKADFNSFNAVLFDRKCKSIQAFVDDVKQYYDGKVYRLDFSRKTACVNLLNNIIKRESRGMFEKIFSNDDFANNPLMVLLNVLYFKSEWESPFEKYLTKKEYFTPFSGVPYKVDMMNDIKSVPYYNDGVIHGITLNYKDLRFKLVALMPVKANIPLQKVTRALEEMGIGHFVRNGSRANETLIKLPRMKLESSNDLNELLKSAGMKYLFHPEFGDLNRMVQNQDLYVAKSQQVVKLNLDETGTEVAAVTYAMPEPASAAPGEEPVFNRFYADRPFVLVLFDTKTNAVLLTAAMVNP